MKARIDVLWETGIEIVVPDTTDEFDKFSSITDLRKCENVLVGKRDEYGLTEILIDDDIRYVKTAQYTHPTGCGKLSVIEIR
jgi:hypothetical protein